MSAPRQPSPGIFALSLLVCCGCLSSSGSVARLAAWPGAARRFAGVLLWRYLFFAAVRAALRRAASYDVAGGLGALDGVNKGARGPVQRPALRALLSLAARSALREVACRRAGAARDVTYKRGAAQSSAAEVFPDYSALAHFAVRCLGAVAPVVPPSSYSSGVRRLQAQ